ncbi:hypothetical protein N7U66_18160 [Lacinutrix neustonica]|uniref:Uncharacterized protein n=1 Tax=Lacinutrix neustonica TaxID=2980107 RepID=A0A9E8SDI3_9FLAO|nr:hypothetical protein [Lacinutrix neustonica]WAC01787.1 hypothetical protein N7U66_18160 [Lacinutrix neustonica]
MKMIKLKVSAMQWLGFTTLILITLVLFASLNIAFTWVFYLVVIGQGSLIFTVFKVLKDDYITGKTFEDFYEDKPIANA